MTVYYQPNAPEVAVLEPGAAAKTWIMPGLGVALVLAGAGVAFLLPRLARPAAAGVTGTAHARLDELQS